MARRYYRAGRPAPDADGENVHGRPKVSPPRDANGRWLKGYSANPYGRTPGSRNRLNRLSDELFGARAADIIATVIRRAIEGDPTALSLAMNRISPATKGSTMSLGPLPALDSIENCDLALESTIQAAACGRITTEECQLLTGWIKLKIDALAARQLAERVKALEARPIDLEARVLGTDHAA